MRKLDLRKELKHLYQPSAKQAVAVEVPEMQFVMVDGVIQPGEVVDQSTAFQEATQTLCGLIYGLKFMSKKREAIPTIIP